MKKESIGGRLSDCFESVPDSAACGLPVYRGKVRDVIEGRDRLMIIATDRISAFDRVLSTIPFKGELLNRISAFWFEATKYIVPNHIVPASELGGVDVPSITGRASIVRKASVLPVEVIVRGFLTGSAWRDYEAGRPVSGIVLPAGLRKDEKFPVPLLTPSTKESSGHDKPISCAQIVETKLVEAGLWHHVEEVSIALFRRGQEIAAKSGLLLVDTKYEFGLVGGKLTLVDEIHTQDSSRYWYADSYETRFNSGESQRELDKESFRRWLMEHGFMGDGDTPNIPDSVRVDTSMRYIAAYETILGENFIPVPLSAQAQLDLMASLVSEHITT